MSEASEAEKIAALRKAGYKWYAWFGRPFWEYGQARFASTDAAYSHLTKVPAPPSGEE